VRGPGPRAGRPAPDHAVEATRPFLGRQVRALVDLQLLTGARPGELLGLRARDVDTSGPGGVWVYRPASHKNAHRGRDRAIYLGPRAQEVLAPFMANRPLDAFLFSPAEAERERLAALHARRATPRSCGNRPGTNRRTSPERSPGDRYTPESYRRAVARACDRAFPPPARLRPSKQGERVLDLFGGSGSTLIAAEQQGRKACLMELDPAYCDVIVQRWETFSGSRARLETCDD
jgi:integrase